MIGINGLLDGYYFGWCPIFPSHGTFTNPCRTWEVLHFLHKPSLEAHPKKLKPSIRDLAALRQWRRFSVDPSGCDEKAGIKGCTVKDVKGWLTIRSDTKIFRVCDGVNSWVQEHCWTLPGCPRWNHQNLLCESLQYDKWRWLMMVRICCPSHPSSNSLHLEFPRWIPLHFYSLQLAACWTSPTRSDSNSGRVNCHTRSLFIQGL